MAGPTFLFDPSLATPKDKVRFLIGDTKLDQNPILADETIVAVLAMKGGNVRTAAIACCESIEAMFAQFTESRAGETMADKTAVSNKYRDIARRIRKMSVSGFAVLTHSQKDLNDSNTDRLRNATSAEDFNNPLVQGLGEGNV